MNMYHFVLSQCCSNVASNFRSPLVLPPHSQFNSLHTLHVVLQPSLSAAYLNTNYYLPPLGCGRKKNKCHKNILLSTDNVLIKVSDGDICQSSKVRSTAFITLRPAHGEHQRGKSSSKKCWFYIPKVKLSRISPTLRDYSCGRCW